MHEFNPDLLKRLYIPDSGSHKGQNGKVLLIAGSELFHAASLWPLTVMSRMCDMVFYASVPENNTLVERAKEEFRNGIVVPRSDLDKYIEEADAILIGPGLMRKEPVSSILYSVSSIEEINKLEDEGLQTYHLTKYILEHFPHKKFVIDGGALQMMEPEWLQKLKQTPILTPNPKEFEMLFNTKYNIQDTKYLSEMAKKYNCVIILKGEVDIVASPDQVVSIPGGNAGMTKGGTGDVLAGLVTALYAKNDAFLSACAASYINKKAGESLESSVGIYFNASDLANEIPKVLTNLLAQPTVQ